MKPEYGQLVSQLIILCSSILLAIGIYGNYYFDKLISKAKENSINTKMDSIPTLIITNNDLNTTKVIEAIDEIKLSIEEINSTDGSKIKELSFPSEGYFGQNILHAGLNSCIEGKYSMSAWLPRNKKIFVKISGTNWAFPVHQAISGWAKSDLVQNDGINTRTFESIKSGIIDFEFRLNGPDTLSIKIFENDTNNLILEKSIVVKK